jgi:phage major head subunit gpT-like protein
MPVVSNELLSATLTASRKVFNDAFPAAEGAQGWTRMVLGGGPQGTDGRPSAQYGWMTDVPKMSPWRGKLELGGLTAKSFTLTNALHKAAFEVERLAFQRDQLGMITPKTQQLAQEAARYPGELITALVNGGASASVDSPVFDGAAFFSNSRAYGDSGTIDNILVSAGTGVANFRLDLASARAQMMSFGDSKGRKLNIAPNVIHTHPNNGMVVYEGLLTGPGANDPGVAPAAPSGQPIWSARGYTVIEDANLSDTGAYYFYHISPGLAPFIMQEEFRPEVETIATAQSELAILEEKFIFAARGAFQVGYGLPWLAIIVT